MNPFLVAHAKLKHRALQPALDRHFRAGRLRFGRRLERRESLLAARHFAQRAALRAAQVDALLILRALQVLAKLAVPLLD